MNLKEEKEYLQNKVNELSDEINKCKKEQSGVMSDIVYWGYTAKLQQLETSLANFKKWLHFTEIKEGLDEYLSDDVFGQRYLKELTFEIIDNYRKILDKKNEYGDDFE